MQQEYMGRYTRVFLNEVFGPENYRIKTFSLETLTDPEGMNAAEGALEDESLSFAYMSDTKLTCVWLKDYPGWLNFCEETGIEITPSPKIAKRLTLLTRSAYLFGKFAVGELNIREIKPHEFSLYNVDPEVAEKFLDGANVISRELVEDMMTNATEVVEKLFMSTGRGNPNDREFYNTAIDHSGSFSLRVSTPDGLIKGDCLSVPKEQMGGYDVMFCSENIKKELKTTKFVFVLAEPHPGHRAHVFSPDEPAPPPVWTDDQSMTWLGEWLFPKEQLIGAMSDFISTVEQDLEAGIYPSFFTSVDSLDDPYSTVAQFQSQALLWERYGPGRNERDSNNPRLGTSLPQSIFLQKRIAQGAVNMLAKSNSSKRRWPVPCAAYVHVANDSWLHMAGYGAMENPPWPNGQTETPRGSVWLHEETGRLIYNDMDFADLYSRHGGWDLDDSVKAHYRTWRGKKVVVIVRSPNSWGEYDIKDYIEGSYHVTWNRKDGTKLSFPEIKDERPKYLEELDINYRHESLSPTEIGASRSSEDLYGPIYTKAMVQKALKTAVQFMGVFGRRANADMVYFHSVKGYRNSQLAPIEAIVDACTQEQSNKALELINADTEAVINEIAASGVPVDKMLWEQRLKRFQKGIAYVTGDWSELCMTHDDLCSLYQQKLFDISQQAVKKINPDILELGKKFEKVGHDMVQWYYYLSRNVPRDSFNTASEFYRHVNDIMVNKISGLEDHMIYNTIMSMARVVYTKPHRSGSYEDTPLFQLAQPGKQSIFQYYLDAIAFYGVGESDWSVRNDCTKCGELIIHTDRVEFQNTLLNSHC